MKYCLLFVRIYFKLFFAKRFEVSQIFFTAGCPFVGYVLFLAKEMHRNISV